MTTLGDLIYENSTPAADRLGGNTTTTIKYLQSVGAGGLATSPSWQQIAYGDIYGTPDILWDRTVATLPNTGYFLSPHTTADRILLGGAVDDGISTLRVNGNVAIDGIIYDPTHTYGLIDLTGTYNPTFISFDVGTFTTYFNSNINIVGGGSLTAGSFITDNLVSPVDSHQWAVNLGSGDVTIGDTAGYYSNAAVWIYQEYGGAIQLRAPIVDSVGTTYTGFFTSIDTNNRILYASDGITPALNWSTGGRVLINGATDDTTSALQLNGVQSFGSNLIDITNDGTDKHIQIGYQASTAGANISTAIGYQTQASGNASMALGIIARAIGDSANAIGYECYANGIASLALGNQTNANGDFSFALGYQTETDADYSTALGAGAYVDTGGAYSTSIGIYAYNAGAYSTAIGYQPANYNDNEIGFSTNDSTYGTDNGNGGYTQLDIYNGIADFQLNNIKLAGVATGLGPPATILTNFTLYCDTATGILYVT